MINKYGIKYIFDQHNLNSRQAKWIAFLSESDFETKHIKGKQKKIVDSLSRRMHHIHMTTIINYETNLKKYVKESLRDDKFYKKIMEDQ